MKLRLPQTLVALAVASLTSAHAATIGTGVSYDNGKGSAPYSADENAHEMGQYTQGEHVGQDRSDGYLCWANSAANLIQYWQDAYEGYVTSAAPKGFNTTQYTSPQGTRYLKIYEKFLEYSTTDEGGIHADAIDWYFLNMSKEGLADREPTDTYVQNNVFSGMESAYAELDFSFQQDLQGLTETLESIFAVQGQAIGLKVWQQDADNMWNDRYHAITCWGFEKKGDVVSALYLTDSDDSEFGVFKVDVELGESIPDWMESYPDMVLKTNDDTEGYGGSFLVNLMAVGSIATPDGYKKTASAVPTLSNETKLTANMQVDKLERTGAGVQIGDGSAIVMLVSADENSNLSLTAEGAGGTGLDVQKGSLASLANLRVSGYDQGINAEGKVYLYGNVVEVKDNILASGDGAGIYNTNYVEIKDAEAVNITGNKATAGKGGGIYNEDVVSITNNDKVTFRGNTAASGNDIYNSANGIVNIADNASVEFLGTFGANSIAIENHGDLYLKSGKDSEGVTAEISFEYAKLDSRGGITYVGRDVKGETAETYLSFADENAEGPIGLILASNPVTADMAAILDHLMVSANEIAGVGAGNSSLKNANVSSMSDYALSEMTIDTSNSFQGFWETNSLSMSNLVIDLAGVELISRTFDISSMFDDFGGMTIDNVYLDASSFNLYEGWDETSFITVAFGDSLKNLDEGTKLTVLLGNNMMTTQRVYAAGGNVTFKGSAIIPEPATGTLSLLALAALAARRRRK